MSITRQLTANTPTLSHNLSERVPLCYAKLEYDEKLKELNERYQQVDQETVEYQKKFKEFYKQHEHKFRQELIAVRDREVRQHSANLAAPDVKILDEPLQLSAEAQKITDEFLVIFKRFLVLGDQRRAVFSERKAFKQIPPPPEVSFDFPDGDEAIPEVSPLSEAKSESQHSYTKLENKLTMVKKSIREVKSKYINFIEANVNESAHKFILQFHAEWKGNPVPTLGNYDYINQAKIYFFGLLNYENDLANEEEKLAKQIESMITPAQKKGKQYLQYLDFLDRERSKNKLIEQEREILSDEKENIMLSRTHCTIAQSKSTLFGTTNLPPRHERKRHAIDFPPCFKVFPTAVLGESKKFNLPVVATSNVQNNQEKNLKL